jgi:O-antigen/teichoic acid export membrane protein
LFIVEAINSFLTPLVQQYGDMAVTMVITLGGAVITLVLAAYVAPKINEIERQNTAKAAKENEKSK